ncbi:hypothetical protein DSAG12_02188 [Promethearchaeum syntrophicum]|uniref:Uncharacterized protein n=1 Tax=Promethearchaeum syntrophicum TaxID=2594042 RepID=A0A5B9DB37_9ARCH|nr:hypothetical protein [Candidatus Prometheoarchaeum syntrophicum]QEE16358.1 hypothetical protein DSAG12_02188 [Candidatus Prometheoarchaeum syntrophicum]
MQEISLEEVENWYLDQLKIRFKREHKVLSKFFSLSEKELGQARNSIKTWKDRDFQSEETKLDDKTQKILERFVDSVVENLDEIRIPSIHIKDISYENSQKYCDSIKKLYSVYNSQGRKAIPRFGKQFKIEIKEVDLHLRKIGDLTQKIGKFLRKNYQDGKIAENEIKNIPQLTHNIERLGSIKGKIDGMDEELNDMKNNLTIHENDLLKLSEDADLQLFEKIEQEETVKSNNLRDYLKFKKAFKKLKKSLEKGTINARGITDNDIRPYIKDPVKTILNEGPKLNRLRDILIKTRLILEDEKDPLKLKKDLRNKIIVNINQIVSENKLEPLINENLEIKIRKEEIRGILKNKGIEQKRTDLKNKISTLTLDVEHFSKDLKHRKREYKELLSKISSDRDDLQKKIEEQIGEEVKIKIIIPN